MLCFQLKPPTVDLLTLREIAARAGLNGARIAQWEQRLGWPVSTRDARGRRRYPAHLVPDLREAARRSDIGRSLRDDIVDGRPVWQIESRQSAPMYDHKRCAALPQPRTEAARRLRDDLLRALDESNDAAVLAVLARVPTIHPDDRAASVFDVLRSLGQPAATVAAEGKGPNAQAPLDGMPPREPPKTDQPVPSPDAISVSNPVAATPPPTQTSGPVETTTPTEPVPASPGEPAETAAIANPSPTPRQQPRRAPCTISDDILADYQAALARERTATQLRRQEAATARERAAAFRTLRAAIAAIDQAPHVDPKVEALRDDRLAMAVHNANGKTRAVLAALLRRLRHSTGT